MLQERSQHLVFGCASHAQVAIAAKCCSTKLEILVMKGVNEFKTAVIRINSFINSVVIIIETLNLCLTLNSVGVG